MVTSFVCHTFSVRTSLVGGTFVYNKISSLPPSLPHPCRYSERIVILTWGKNEFVITLDTMLLYFTPEHAACRSAMMREAGRNNKYALKSGTRQIPADDLADNNPVSQLLARLHRRGAILISSWLSI